MSERSVVVKLAVDASGFKAGVDQARSSLTGLTSQIAAESRKQGVAFQKLGLGLTAIGAAAAVGVGVAVKSFADFDQAMSGLAATGEDARGSLEEMRTSILSAAEASKFSATEVAAGATEMAKAGLSAADIIGGGLAGALDLAAAGAVGVAEASETVATALSVFNLEGGKATHVADLLAAGAGKAQGSVSDIGAALNQSALVANQFGLSIEETAGSLALFASEGLTGSDAGTAFKTMLQSIGAPTAEAKTQMEALGISMYDANGQFVGMESIAGQLQEQMSGLSEETRNAALRTIFGADAIRTANALYEGGAQSVQQWTAKVNDAGYAAEAAAIMMDNLNGDLETLKGALQTALIETGGSADGVLRSMTQSATTLVTSYSALGPAAHGATLIVGGLTAAIGLSAGAALLAVPKIAAFKAAVTTVDAAGVATGMTRLGTAVTAVGRAAAVAAPLAVGLVGAFIAFEKLDPAQPVDELTKSLQSLATTGSVKGALSAIDSGLVGTVDSVEDLRKVLTDATSEMENFWDSADSLVGTSAGEDIKALDAALAAGVESGHAEEMAKGFDVIAEQAYAAGLSLAQLTALLPQYDSSLSATGGTMGTVRQKFLDAADAIRFQKDELEGLPGSYGDVGPAAEGAADAQVGSAGLAQDAIEAEEAEVQALIDTYDRLRGINSSVGDTESARQQAIDDLAETVGRLTGAVDANGVAVDTSEQSISDIIATYGDLGDALNDNLTDFDLNTQAGRDLRDAVKEVADSEVAAAEATRDWNVEHGMKSREANDIFVASLAESRAGLSLTFQSMGLAKDVSDALALSIIEIPNVKTTKMLADDEDARRKTEAAEERYRLLEKARETKLNADESDAVAGANAAKNALDDAAGNYYADIYVQTHYSTVGGVGSGGAGLEGLGRSAAPGTGGAPADGARSTGRRSAGFTGASSAAFSDATAGPSGGARAGSFVMPPEWANASGGMALALRAAGGAVSAPVPAADTRPNIVRHGDVVNVTAEPGMTAADEILRYYDERAVIGAQTDISSSLDIGTRPYPF